MIIEIEDKLKNIVSEIVKNYTLLSVNGTPKKIDVFRGIIPFEKTGDIIPAVAVRISKGKNTLEKRELDVHVILETTNKDTEKGYEEHMKIVQEIVDGVISKGTIENVAEILPEAKWEFSEEQLYPDYVTEITFNLVSRKAYRTDVDDWINGKEYR